MMDSKKILHQILSWASGVVIILTLISPHHGVVSAQQKDQGGCTAPPILPDLPFFVVWNHPSSHCESHGVHLGFEKWGIVDNEQDRFFGSKISLFYGGPWHWPNIQGSNTPVDGGIPQSGNLTRHLVESRRVVSQTITNKNFTGLSVIDFESWRPLYRLNFDSLKKYQKMSLDLAGRMYPKLNQSMLVKEATQQFNRAARVFMEETLKEVESLRPYGKWGYYGYPRLFGRNSAATAAANDEMGWIFNHSTGYYPSIYFQLSRPGADRADVIKKKMKESLRLKAKFSRHDTVIFPYANNQNGPYKTFSVADLNYAIGLPANLGASGVVLWGSSSSMHAKNECRVLQDYIQTTLGPYVQNATNFFSNCSQQLCDGHGRCMQKYHEAVYQRHLEENGRTDCRIPAHRLKRKKKNLQTNEGHDSETSPDRNRVKSFYDVIVQKLNYKPGYFSYRSLTDPTSDKGHVIRGLGTPGHTRRDQNVVNFSISQSSTPQDESDEDNDDEAYDNEEAEENSFDFSLPNDFDDYVCKCYAGWAGTHCRQKHEVTPRSVSDNFV